MKKIKVKNQNGKDSMTLISSSDMVYDDCPICQAMKKAEEDGKSLNEKELKEVFDLANKQDSSES
ncbi:MAG: hypothetical protein Q7R43_00390 [Candidatus Daviesbacteria bacterium]|nr:hypothetical protein [Candidatus Daviesbacteria bacterium]